MATTIKLAPGLAMDRGDNGEIRVFHQQPDQGLSDEEMMNAGAPKGLSDEEMMAAGAAAPSYGETLLNNLQKRSNQLGDVTNAISTGQQGIGQTVLQDLGVGAGAINDVVGQGISTLAKGAYGMLSPENQQKIENQVKVLINSDAGKAGLRALQTGGEAWGNFKAQNPNAARDIESVGNIVTLGIGLPVGGAVKAGTEMAAEGVGKLGGMAGEAALNAVTPQAAESMVNLAQTANKYNIPYKFSDVTESKPVQYATSMADKAPLSGATAFDSLQQTRFNNEIGKTIGVDTGRITPEVLDEAYKKTGALFDKALAGRKVILDNNAIQKLTSITAEADPQITGEALDLLRKNVIRVFDSIGPDGTIPGEKLGALRSSVAKIARNTGLSDAKPFLGDLTNVIADISTQGNSEAKATLDKARQQWKNLITIEPLAAKHPEGNIPPSQLVTLVQRHFNDYSTGGGGQLGDLARIGKGLLGHLQPDSGTATRQAYKENIKAIGATLGTLGATGHVLPLAGAVGGLTTARGISAANRKMGTMAVKKAIKQNPNYLLDVGR